MASHSPRIFNFSEDSISYIAPSWHEMTAATFDLSQMIEKQNKKFDVLVTLAKGGWPLARVLADFLNISTGISLGVKFYTGLQEKTAKPIVYQDITPISEVVGKDVILFDDVSDSGESLVFAKQYLRERGTKSITTTTLYYKSKTICKPDFYAGHTDAWIIFPFEIAESIRQLQARWSTQNVTRAEQTERFTQLGFEPEWVAAAA